MVLHTINCKGKTYSYRDYQIQWIVETGKHYEFRLKDLYTGTQKSIMLQRECYMIGRITNERYYKIVDTETNEYLAVPKKNIKNYSTFIFNQIKFLLENV
jgi:hypothetical protein